MTTGQKSKAKRSTGTLLKMESPTSPSSFLTIGDVRSINPAGAKFDEFDKSHLNSPTDDKGVTYKEVGFAMKDPGSYDVEFNWTDEDNQDLLDAAEGTEVNFEVHYPQLGYKRTFAALVGAVVESPDPKAQITAKVPLRITGAVTKVSLA